MAFRKANINRKLRKLKRIRINQEFSDFDTSKSFIGRIANMLFDDLPKSVSALLMSEPLSYVFWFCWIVLGSNLFGNLWEPGLAPLVDLLAVSILGFLGGAFLLFLGGAVGFLGEADSEGGRSRNRASGNCLFGILYLRTISLLA
jgi:hypothetical protein